MMRTVKTLLATALLSAVALSFAPGQEGFGFGDETPGDGLDAADSGGSPALGARIGGSLEVGGSLFIDEMDDIGSVSLGDLYSARLSIEASGSRADAILRLKASRSLIEDSPEDIVDEARLRLSSGPFSLEGGLMRLTWGKADSQGPLDVLNPLDLSDLTVTDALDRKVARPMLRASLSIGSSTSVEAVALPGFEGYVLATEGRWRPSQFDDLESTLAYIDVLRAGYALPAAFTGVTYASLLESTDMSGLAHSQAGARLTTSLGPVDLGLQYFYGYLFTPAVKFAGSPLPSSVELVYNRYHQVGADFAAVLAGFNARAELAANITEDLAGDDPSVYNPNLAFSLGFDRDLVAGINLNLQYAGTYRLMDGEIDDSSTSYDVEKGTEALSSALTAVLSKSLLKDALDLRLTALWELDDKDYLIKPSVAYAIGDAEVELSAGVFGGEGDGQMGQYADSSYLSVAMRYSF